MPAFKDMISELEKVEKNGYVAVEDKKYNLPIKVGIVADKAFMWKALGRGKVCSSGRFCWLCKVTAIQRHQGQPGGCAKCRRKGTVYGLDGTQVCLHWDIICRKVLGDESQRLLQLRTFVKPTVPLHARPSWVAVDDLRNHCEERCLNNKDRLEVSQMNMASLEQFLLSRTSTGCVLGKCPFNGVKECDMELVRSECSARGICVEGDDVAVREKLQERLQLEDELTRLEVAYLDKRFENIDGVLADPSRHFLDLLHLPMRTNEKIVHMLKLKVLDRWGGKTASAIKTLTELDDVFRTLGGMSDKWVGHIYFITILLSELHTHLLSSLSLIGTQMGKGKRRCFETEWYTV
jgi:hypothetical protein